MTNTVVMVIFKNLGNKHLLVTSRCHPKTRELTPNKSHVNHSVSALNGWLKFDCKLTFTVQTQQ